MANTVKLCPTLYSRPPKAAIGGARVEFATISVLTTDLITTQLLAMACLPAGHRLVGAAMECTDMDTGTPALTITVGILNSYYNAALNAAPALEAATYDIFTASTLGQAGGRARSLLRFSTAIGVDQVNDRIIAVAFPAAPATPAAGTLSLILTMDQD